MSKKGLLLVFSTAVISGFSIFINKFGVALADPYIFAFLKNATVALALTGLILFLKNRVALRNLKPKQWLLLVLIGLIGGSIPFLLFFKGLTLTSAAQGSFIQKTMFIYVAAMAAIFLKEKLSRNFLTGALLLLLGNTLLLKTLNFSFGYGDLLIFFATLFWAIENIISKYTLKDLPAKTVAWGRMFFGSIFILGFLATSGRLNLITALNFGQISWVLITAAILFGYVITWYSGLKHAPVSTATAILLLGSPITSLLQLISGAKLSPKEIIAIIIIFSGVFLMIGLWQKTWRTINLRRENYVRT